MNGLEKIKERKFNYYIKEIKKIRNEIFKNDKLIREQLVIPVINSNDVSRIKQLFYFLEDSYTKFIIFDYLKSNHIEFDKKYKDDQKVLLNENQVEKINQHKIINKKYRNKLIVIEEKMWTELIEPILHDKKKLEEIFDLIPECSLRFKVFQILNKN